MCGIATADALAEHALPVYGSRAVVESRAVANRQASANRRASAEEAGELEALMARYVAGDLAAFDALYARIGRRVLAFLLSMSRNPERANDLCQITFMKVHRARSGWIPGSPVMPWVMAIARNTLIDDARSAGRSSDKVTLTGELPELAADDDVLRDLADHEDREHLSRKLADAIEKLAASQREALLLTKRSGLSIREAAQVLGTTESAVKLRVHRAYESLRAALAPEGDA
jgi:RNA polymerase sigma-70 factor, ECF subfamily